MTAEVHPLRARTVATVAALLSDGFDVRIRLSGWSMKPIIRSGARVRFSPVPAAIELGDVVLTRHAQGALVAHRVVAVGTDWIQTKGDACRSADAPVRREQVIACAVGLESFVSIPMRSWWMRLLGRALNRIYPKLVSTYRGLLAKGAEAR